MMRIYAGPDHWNDPDMMEVGNAMAANEYRAHFSMCCMLDAPLIAGNDLKNMSQETIDILTNKDAITINQNPLDIQGFKYSSKDSLEIWIKSIAKDEWAVCFLNRSAMPKSLSFPWKEDAISDTFSNRKVNFNQANFL